MKITKKYLIEHRDALSLAKITDLIVDDLGLTTDELIDFVFKCAEATQYIVEEALPHVEVASKAVRMAKTLQQSKDLRRGEEWFEKVKIIAQMVNSGNKKAECSLIALLGVFRLICLEDQDDEAVIKNLAHEALNHAIMADKLAIKKVVNDYITS